MSFWFIGTGLMALLDLRFANSGIIMGLLALAAGIAILLDA